MIHISTVPTLFSREPFEVSARRFRPSGLKTRPEIGVFFSGTPYSSTGMYDPVRISGYVFDPEIKSKDF